VGPTGSCSPCDGADPVAVSSGKIPLGTIYLGLRSFIVLQIAVVLVISYVPALSLWLARFVG
jgi:TRAP-type C4-dicarboxylate transport system permease large subunit